MRTPTNAYPNNTRASVHRRRSPHDAVRLCAITSAAAMTTVLLCAGSAYGADWMEVSCLNPNQSAAPSEGWSSFTTGAPGYGSNNATGCGPGNPMFAILSAAAPVGVGAGEILQYTPPSGSTLVGGSMDVALYADGGGYNASGTAVAYTPAFQYDASDVFFQCASGLAPCAPNSYDFAGVLGLPANRGGSLYVGAGCGGAAGYACNTRASNGAWSLVQVWWANLLLSSSATPAGSGFAGTLLQPSARGTQDLTFTASDPGGPGVYAVSAELDGTMLYAGTPDSNGGRCVPVGSSAGALMFDYSQPCRQSESVDLPIDTTAVVDGQHTLKLTVEDAAGNVSTVYDATLATQNAPVETSAPTIVSTGQVFAGTALSAQPGPWSAPSGAGPIAYGYQWQQCDPQGNDCQAIAGAQSATYAPAPRDIAHTLRVLVSATDDDGSASAMSSPTSAVLSLQGTGAANGRGASEAAQLSLGVAGRISRTFARRAFTLAGRLLGVQEQPIGGAILEVLQQVSGSARVERLRFLRTGSDGSFKQLVPAGPSRLIEVVYRAFSDDPNYTARASVEESVRAGVQLDVSPRRTGPTGTIVLSGRVLGPIPRAGVVVEMLVHYLGQWEPFRTARTNKAGHFRVRYRFEGAVGRFPFRAEVFSGQSGFPFTHGDSGVIDVRSV